MDRFEFALHVVGLLAALTTYALIGLALAVIYREDHPRAR